VREATYTKEVSLVTTNPIFSLDVLNVARLLGVLVPLLVALITKRFASSAVKSIANLVLSAVAGVVAPIIAGDKLPNSIGEVFNAILNAFIVSIVAYYGLFKPTGAADAVASSTAGFGLGSDPGKHAAQDEV
jgi:hypothetical protein